MPPQHGGHRVRLAQVPQPHRLILTARGQGLPIWAEGHGGDPILMAPEDGGRRGRWRRSHSRTVLSSLPEARVCPSGLKATD